MGAAARLAIHTPGQRRGTARAGLDARPDLAAACAQIIAEPGHGDRDSLEPGARGLQAIQRHNEIRRPCVEAGIQRSGGASTLGGHDPAREPELPHAIAQHHGADQPLGAVRIRDRAKHLEGELRQAVAITLQRQILEDHVSRATIGGRVGRPHSGRDERIAALALIAQIPAPGDAGHVHRLAVGPDAANSRNRSFRQRHGKAGVIQILGRRDLGPAAALAANTLGAGAHLLAEIRGPDNVAAHAHAPRNPWNDGAFSRGGQAQAVEACTFYALAGGERGYDPAVDDRTDRGADEAADCRPGEAEDRAGNQ